MYSSEIIELEKISKINVQIIGDCPVILYNVYAKEQAWFPFMTGAIFYQVVQNPPVEPPSQFNLTKKLRKKRMSEYVGVTDEYRMPYPNMTENQYVIPFYEFKKVTNSQMRKLEEQNFLNWEVDSSGKPYTVDITQLNKNSTHVEKWLKDNTIGRYHMSPSFVRFERATDAIMIKMQFM